MTIKISQAHTLLFEKNKPIIKVCDVYLQADRLAAIISDHRTPAPFSPTKTIDGQGKLLLPGLINGHTHAYMTILRHYADDLPFHDWLFKKIIPRENKMTEKDAYWSTMLACAEMLLTGTTCFLDMHMFPNAVAQAVIDSGMRAVLSRGLVGGSNPDGQKRLQQAEAEISQYQNHPRLSFMYAPHAIYTCDQELLQLSRTLANQKNLSLHLHLSESLQEIADCFAQHSCSPVEYLDRLGIFQGKTTIAHGVHLSQTDIKILKKNQVNVVHNPTSNLKLGNGIAPLPALLEAKINVCLGTDSAASNNALDIFHEMNLAALIHKGHLKDAQAIPASTVIKMATINGSQALDLATQIGQIKVGYQADLILIDMNQTSFYPRQNLLASLCYSPPTQKVDTVIINGQIVVEQNKPTLFDLQEVYARLDEIKL